MLAIRCVSRPNLVRLSVAIDNGAIVRRAMSTNPEKDEKSKPIKFSTSDAHIGYKAQYNFYGDARDLPDSHNYFLGGSLMVAVFYLFLFRDHEVDGDGGKNLIKPLHEVMPHMAIPLLKAAIEENRKNGMRTRELEKKLAEYMKDPEKHGQGRRTFRDV